MREFEKFGIFIIIDLIRVKWIKVATLKQTCVNSNKLDVLTVELLRTRLKNFF